MARGSNRHPKSFSASGFTLIELMLATIFFSLVLVVMLAAFLQIGRMYYKGISVNNTYEAAWSVTTDIENDSRFAQSATCDNGQNCSPVTNNNIHYFCIGDHRYTYYIGNLPYKVQGADISSPDVHNPKGIIQDTVSGCPDPTKVAGSSPSQLLSQNMQLNDMVFQCQNGNCYIHLHIIFYGSDDTIFTSSENPNNPSGALLDKDNSCSGGLLSTEFCAVADITSLVSMNG